MLLPQPGEGRHADGKRESHEKGQGEEQKQAEHDLEAVGPQSGQGQGPIQPGGTKKEQQGYRRTEDDHRLPGIRHKPRRQIAAQARKQQHSRYQDGDRQGGIAQAEDELTDHGDFDEDIADSQAEKIDHDAQLASMPLEEDPPAEDHGQEHEHATEDE